MEWSLKGFNYPVDQNVRADTDYSALLIGEDISKYGMMVGSLNWLVTLRRYNIYYTVYILARHMMMPRQAHIYSTRQVLGYLKQNCKVSIDCDVYEPVFS